MTEPLTKPKRKDPLKKTRQPLLPLKTRSRTAQGLTAAAAEGRFALQVCGDCHEIIYPPRDACPKCLSPRLPFEDVPNGGRLLAETTIRTSIDVFFRERMPWRVGVVVLDCGPSIVTHLHGDVREGARVRLALKLDRSGEAVAIALPEQDTLHMADDPEWRELTCDPKFRRVLISDGRNAVGQAMAKAMSAAEAGIIFVGIADPWKPFPGEASLREIPRVEIVPLDMTDSVSVEDIAGEIGGRVDILINTAEHVRAGGLIERKGLNVAREEMDIRYLGLTRLAQAFGPTLRARGADGVNSAAALVNLLSVFALMNWPAFGAFSATEAACLSAAQCLRAELRPGGVKVVNMFFGPLDTEWYQTVPPPKVTPAALANATIDALRRGLEDVYVGDIANDVRGRLATNPKALERELGT
ncbi:MAG: SDR family NAD(P)-dependent oxidoreductase [Stellaceae bacterium]